MPPKFPVVWYMLQGLILVYLSLFDCLVTGNSVILKCSDKLTQPPAIISPHRGISPLLFVKKSLTVSFMVSLMAFSGDTPTN